MVKQFALIFVTHQYKPRRNLCHSKSTNLEPRFPA